MESFLCSVGFSSETHHGSFRHCLTKVIIFIQVLDDVYDIYGSLDELEQFTNAVDSRSVLINESSPRKFMSSIRKN